MQVDRADDHAENVGRDETELRGSETNDTNDQAVDATEHPPFPTAPADQNRGSYGQHTRNIIKTKHV